MWKYHQKSVITRAIIESVSICFKGKHSLYANIDYISPVHIFICISVIFQEDPCRVKDKCCLAPWIVDRSIWFQLFTRFDDTLFPWSNSISSLCFSEHQLDANNTSRPWVQQNAVIYFFDYKCHLCISIYWK